MKRLAGLWDAVVDFDNLYLANQEAARGKRRKPAVAAFALDLEPNLLSLREALMTGRYQPGRYRMFTIYEPKRRMIAAAPFVDRVVHHALMRVVEPLLDPGFIHDSYACRKGKGVHRAVDRYQTWARHYTRRP